MIQNLSKSVNRAYEVSLIMYKDGAVSFQVCSKIKQSDFMVDVNYDPGETLNKKIRNAQLAQYNFILGKRTVFSRRNFGTPEKSCGRKLEPFLQNLLV